MMLKATRPWALCIIALIGAHFNQGWVRLLMPQDHTAATPVSAGSTPTKSPSVDIPQCKPTGCNDPLSPLKWVQQLQMLRVAAQCASAVEASIRNCAMAEPISMPATPSHPKKDVLSAQQRVHLGPVAAALSHVPSSSLLWGLPGTQGCQRGESASKVAICTALTQHPAKGTGPAECCKSSLTLKQALDQCLRVPNVYF